MSRRLFLTYKDRRGSMWSKRGRIYEAPAGVDWKVVLEDQQRQLTLYVPGREQAEEIVNEFASGLSVLDMKERHQ